MKKGLLLAALALQAASITSLVAGVYPGSESAGFKFSGGNLTASGGMTLTDGEVNINSSSSTFTGDIAATRSYITVDDGSDYAKLYLTGTYAGATGNVTLDTNGDKLRLDAGELPGTVTTSANVRVEGTGSFGGNLTVSSGVTTLDLQAPMNHHIDNSGTISLSSDLTFSEGEVFVNNGGTVNGNGYRMVLDGATMSVAQTWNNLAVELAGMTTLNSAITISSFSSLNGNGDRLTMTGSAAFAVGASFTLADVRVASFRDGNITTLDGNTLTLRDTIFSDSSATANEILVHNGSMIGPDNPVLFTSSSGSGSTTWGASNISLLANTTIGDNSSRVVTWTLGGDMVLNGNGNTLNLDNGVIDMDGNDIYMSDIALTEVKSASFVADGDMYMSNVTLMDSGKNAALIIGSSEVDAQGPAKIDMANGEFFDSAVDFDNGVNMALLSNSALTDTWKFSGASILNGRGHTLDMKTGVFDLDADLALQDIVLTNMVAASVASTPSDFLMTNVTVIDDASNDAVRITGSNTGDSSNQSAAQVSVTSGAFFDADVAFDNGAVIELLDSVTLGTNTDWTFSQNSIINGHGNVLDLSASGAKLHIADGKTLRLINVVLKGWGANSVDTQVTFDGAGSSGGTLELSDTTIILGGNVSLLADENITVSGPTTIVTGANTFDASAGTSSNTLNVTLWYDPLTTADANNVTFGTAFTGSGRVAAMSVASSGDVTYDDGTSHTSEVVDTMFLNYEVSGVGGRQVTLDNSSGAFTLDGNGRTFILGKAPASSSATPMTLSGSDTNLVSITDLRIDGFSSSHITQPSGATNGNLIRYNNGCLLKLQEDETLSDSLFFGNSSGDSVVLDLNGKDLDLSAEGATLILAESDVASTLTIKNGRIINLSDHDSSGDYPRIVMTADGNSGTLILQDVDIMMDGDTTFTNGKITIKGDCSIGVVGGTGSTITRTATFTNNSGAADALKIDAGATLKLLNNVTYEHTGQVDNFSMVAANSTLELEGATFLTSGNAAASDGLQLRHGTVKADNTSKLSGNVELGGTNVSGNALHIDMMPAAKVDVIAGTVKYSNDS